MSAITQAGYAIPGAPWVEAAFAGPLYDSIRAQLDALSAFPDLDELNRLAQGVSLHNADGRTLVFAAPARSSKNLRVVADHYESRVLSQAAIETRPDDWHDMFNSLVWLAWPRTKTAINALHVREVHSGNGGKRGRGPARDVATLFDESGAIIACAEPGLAELLRQFRWHELFCARRAEVESHMRCFVFGHALLDRGRNPYKSMTAHALILPVERRFFAQSRSSNIAELDERLAGWFRNEADLESTRVFAPLPLLGFPGFSPANTDPSFYDDAAVFRPGRINRQR